MSYKTKEVDHTRADHFIELILAVGREIGHLGGVRLIAASKAMERGHVSPNKIYEACRADIGEDALNRGYIAREGSPMPGVESCGLTAISGYVELRRIYGKEWLSEAVNLFVKSWQCPSEAPYSNPSLWLNTAELFYRAVKYSACDEHEKRLTDEDMKLFEELRASAPSAA